MSFGKEWPESETEGELLMSGSASISGSSTAPLGLGECPSQLVDPFAHQGWRFTLVNAGRALVVAGLCGIAGVGLTSGIYQVIQRVRGAKWSVGSSLMLGGGVGATTGAVAYVAMLAIGLWRQSRTSPSVVAVEQKSLSSDASLEDVHQGIELEQFVPCEIFLPKNEVEAVRSKHALIESAQQTLRISCCYGGGTSLDKTCELIEGQLQKNEALHVRLLTNSDFIEKGHCKKFSQLSRVYGERFEYLIVPAQLDVYPRLKRRENHVKLIVADDTYFQLGGIEDIFVEGVQEDVRPPGLKVRGIRGEGGIADADIVGHSPELGSLVAKQFDGIWKKWSNIAGCSRNTEPLPFAGPAASLPQESDGLEFVEKCDAALSVYAPEHGAQNGWLGRIVHNIESSQEGDTIWVAQMCVNEDTLIGVLREAARRGVAVKVITNGRHGFKPTSNIMTGVRNRARYAALGEGIEIYEYPQHQRLYHKKVWVFERQDAMHASTVFFGSANITKKSMYSNDEMMLEVRSEDLADRVIEQLTADIGDTQPLSAEQIAKYAGGLTWAEAYVQEVLLCNLLS